MNRAGLVSISFRQLPPEEIAALARDAGLAFIEWGSDVHAPPPPASRESACPPGSQPPSIPPSTASSESACPLGPQPLHGAAPSDRLRSIAALTRRAGLAVSSYGTYFRIGSTPFADFPAHLEAASLLGTRIVRAWAGTKSFAAMTADDFGRLANDAREAAAMAASAGVKLCLECHPNTATDCPEGTAKLLDAVASPALRMYWQPNQYHDFDWNMRYLRGIAPLVEIAHVFNWRVGQDGKVTRHPLAEASGTWREYISVLPQGIPLLLEFMPDNRPESLATESSSLLSILG